MPASSRLTVRRLGRGDGPLLRELRTAAVNNAPKAFLADPDVEMARPVDQWQDVADRGHWLAAFWADHPAGLVSLVDDTDVDRRYVEAMWVSPEHRGAGIARAFLVEAQAVALAEGRDAIYLWVLDGNPDTRSFYLALGFRPTDLVLPVGPIQGRRTEEEFFLRIAADSGS